MFLFLLLATALVVTAAAPASQPFTIDVDKLAYELIKARNSDLPFYLLIPAVGYYRTEKMQVVVLALPYIPEDSRGSSAAEIGGAVIESIRNNSFTPLIKALSKYRNVLFPYETFRIKLVFIIFVNTQSLIGMGLDAVKDLLKPSQYIPRQQCGKEPQSAGLLYFISPVLNYMSYNIRENSTKVNNIINNLQTYIKDVSSVINSYQVCTRKVSYDGNKTFKEGGCTREIRCITKCVDKNCTKTVLSCTDTCSCNFNLDVNYKTLGSEGKAGDLGYRINLRREIYNNTLKSESRTCSYTFTPDDRSRRYFIDTFLNYYIPTPTQLKAVFTGYGDNKISEIRADLYSNIFNYLEERIRFPRVNGSSCDLDEIHKSINQTYIQYVRGARNKIENEINGANNAINNVMKKNLENSGVKDELLNQLNEVSNRVVSALKEEALKCIDEIVQDVGSRAISAVVSSVPVAGQIYALANGIVGALQRQVIINGSIQLPSDYVLKVTSPICRGGKITSGGDEFESKPSAGEAIVAGILGFASGVLKSFGGGGEFLDLIPIVREVDLPQVKVGNTLVKYYYMTTSRPGIYNITISLNITNLIDNTKKYIKDSIQDALKKAICDKNIMGNKLISVLENSFNRHIEIDPYEVVSSDETQKFNNVGDGDKIINITLISVPPYIYGGVSGGAIRYNYSYDLTGLLRVHIKFVESLICDGVGNLVTNICNKKIGGIVDKILDNVFKDVKNIINAKISDGSVCSPRGIVLRSIKTVAGGFVDEFAKHVQDTIRKEFVERGCGFVGQTTDYLFMNILGFKEWINKLCELLDASYLAAYVFAVRPVRPPESPTVKMCYGAVVTPYFRYKMPEVTQENFIKIILNNIDYISSGRCEGCGNSLLEILRKEGSLRYRFLFIEYSFGVSGGQNKWRISLTTSFPPLLPLFPPLSVEWGVEGDAREVLTSDLFRDYLILLDKSSVRNNVFSEIQGDQFFNVLMSLAWDYRNVELPVGVGGFGVNLFFSAFRVYPAVVLRE
ncbi:MAG: hypothetical protein QW680_12705, partial [Pyrobaculum sp.]